MASEIMATIEKLPREREELESQEDAHHADTRARERLREVEHALRVLWDLRRREMSGERVQLDQDFLDRYSVDPGDDPPVSPGQ